MLWKALGKRRTTTESLRHGELQAKQGQGRDIHAGLAGPTHQARVEMGESGLPKPRMLEQAAEATPILM